MDYGVPEQNVAAYGEEETQYEGHYEADEGNYDSIDNLDDSAGVKHDSSSSAGKLFVGGIAWETSEESFSRYFKKFGELSDSVIMLDKISGRPRGFGFVTFADPDVADNVLQEEHYIDGRTVEVKRTVPREDMQGRGVSRTKKIFVGGLPLSLNEDDLREYFSAYDNIVEHQIMLDHKTGRSRGFGFITFENEDAVDKILSDGRMHELGGKQVEIKRAEPKRSGFDHSSESRFRRGSNSSRSSGNFAGGSDSFSGGYSGKMGRGYGGYGSYGGYGGYGNFPGSYASGGAGFYAGYDGYGYGYGFGGPMYGGGAYGGGGFGAPVGYGGAAGYGMGKGYGGPGGGYDGGKGFGFSLFASRDVVEIVDRYDADCIPSGLSNNKVEFIQGPQDKTCNRTLTVPKHMKQPIYVYYQLDGFYQNHRRYVKSRNDKQLREQGSENDTDGCSPEGTTSNGVPIVPCGLIAWSLFNDTYDLTRNNRQLAINKRGISWKSDRDHKFGKDVFPRNFQNGTLRGGGTLDASKPLSQQEDLIVWMRTAALPTFRKLYGKVEVDLQEGEVISVTLENNYNTYSFDGKKKLVLSTTSWLGGKNDFVGIAYLTVGGLCFFLALVFILIYLIKPRQLGDPSYLSWNRNPGGH